MLEASIIRAGNMAGVYERNNANYLGGLVSAIRGDVLSSLISIANKNGSADRIAWGDACPYVRDLLRYMANNIVVEMHSCLADHANLYERMLHHEMVSSNLPIETSYFPLDKDDLSVLLSIQIDGKTVEEYIRSVVTEYGNKVLKTCESTVVKQYSIPEFIVALGGLVDKQMEEMRKLVELTYLSYSAVISRQINEHVIDSFDGAANAD